MDNKHSLFLLYCIMLCVYRTAAQQNDTVLNLRTALLTYLFAIFCCGHVYCGAATASASRR
jgi:hypothetical protein